MIKPAQLKPLFKRKRDNHARKLKREKLINYLQTELRSCTTHGLPYLVNADIHWLERVYWAINFVICCVIFILLLSSQLSRYINTPVVMSVEMDYYSWNVSYPAISLCPRSKIDQELFSNLLNETKERTGKNLHSYYWSIATISLESLDQLSSQSPDIVQLFPDFTMNANMRTIIGTRLILLVKTNDYADITAMLFETFDNSSLTTNTNWPISVETVLGETGMCHVINSNIAVYHNPIKWKDEPKAYVKNNIELTAHDVDFYTQIINYADVYKVSMLGALTPSWRTCPETDKSVEVISTTSMAKSSTIMEVVNTDVGPDEIPIATSPSVTYDVDGFLFLGYHVWPAKISRALRRVPVTVRKCRFLHEPLSKRFPIYTYNHCLMDCRIEMIKKLCGCVPHFYKILAHEKICDLTELLCVIQYKNEITTLAVSNDTLNKFENTESLPRSPHDCHCLSPCESEVYLKDDENFLPQSSISRLRISISTFPKLRVKREFIFSWDDILLKTGGVINLCIGSSVISIMELIILFIRIPLARLSDWVVKKIKKIKYL